MLYGQAFYTLKNELQPLYDEREAVAIAHELMEFITGLSKTQRLTEKETAFSESQQELFDDSLKSLRAGTPLQYVTGSAWFMGKEYHVNRHVLIPRPETEELVQWIVDDRRGKTGTIQVIDIGTGSGCIAISLQSAVPGIDVTAIDVSNDALRVAGQNTSALNARVELIQMNFLDDAAHNKLAQYDVIVSNPPYIPESDKKNMHVNVTNFEPALALFVPDGDPLLFYRAIAQFGKEHLLQTGYIYCEIESGHAEDCKAIFEAYGYKNTELRKDMHGNWRMIRVGA